MTTFPTQIFDISSDTVFNAELHDEIAQTHLDDWRLLWQPALENYKEGLRAKGINEGDPKWPESGHWDWPGKMNLVRGLLNYTGYSITCGGETQGLMLLNFSEHCARIPGQKGQQLVYIEYLEVAPWNWPQANPQIYRSVGQALMHAAFERSVHEGFKGRLGLHSLPQAVPFYERCGMENLGTKPNECGGLPYFEATPNIAEAYLKGKQP